MVSTTSGRIVVAVCSVLVLGACSSNGSDPVAAGATTTSAPPTVVATQPVPIGTNTVKPTVKATSTAKSVAPPPGATGTPQVAISKAPSVKVGRPATIKTGVRVTIGKVSTLTVGAKGPGEIAGDAVAVSVAVKNASGATFDLGGLSVTAFFGKSTPASPTESGPSHPMSGKLKSGANAKGSYVFLVPKAQADTVRIEVSSNQAATILVFRS